MFGQDWLAQLPVAVSAILASGLFYWALLRVWPKGPRRLTLAERPSSEPAFLFDGDHLLDATPGGQQLVTDRPEGLTELDALALMLQRDFPDLQRDFNAVLPGETLELRPLNGTPLMITIAHKNGLKRVILGAQDGDDVDLHYAALARTAFGEELAMLRHVTSAAPQLIWRENKEGKPVWANRAYLTYSDRNADSTLNSGQVWPGHRLFDDLNVSFSKEGQVHNCRSSVQLKGEKSEHWFDITSMPFEDGTLHFATDANATVRAENAQREFMQTLGKTFADLSTGLAIFNDRRQLSMFNPALLDMTGLDFGFLSTRPTIDMLLDRLRDMRRLPEPKDYTSWREQFSQLEAEAKEGTYCETWDLPDGQTFRVTGRPHPDGALAFLFEDISAEVSLTRHFRSELETSQAVLDTFPDAIAVFSSANTLVMTNAAYRDLWGLDEEEVLQSLDLKSVMRTWRDASLPSPIWPRLEDFAASSGIREPWSDLVTLLDGRHATCYAQAISGRMTMLRFKLTTPQSRTLSPMRVQAHQVKLAER